MTSDRCAPSAILIPISRVRRETEYRHHPVHADRGEHHRDTCEDPEQDRVHARARNPIRNELVHRRDIEESGLGLEISSDLPHRRENGGWICAGAHRKVRSEDEYHVARPLAMFGKHLWSGLSIETRLPNVSDNADDFPGLLRNVLSA
jgi:hypothetical protein